MSTASEAALHICLSVSRFRDLVAEGVFRRMPPGKYSLNVVREAYCQHAQKRMAGRAADGGEALSTQRAKLAAVQTQRLEFEAALEQGQYVHLDVMKRLLIRSFAVFREQSLGMPGKLADSLVGLDRTAIHEVIRSEVYSMLTDFSSPDGVLSQAIDESTK
jgi:phage terminase Nu1 subunit (DNA packaging protein)